MAQTVVAPVLDLGERPQVTGDPLSRLLRTIFLEHRIPYRIEVAWDALLKKLGKPYKTIRVNGISVRVRRLTCDQDFVYNIIPKREYTREFEPAGTVIDIGGNIGSYTLLAAKTARRIVVYEPDPANFALLEQNLRLNRCLNVEARREAVGAQTGTACLFQSDAGGGFHTSIPGRLKNPGGSTIVSCVSLEDVFRRNEIEYCDLLKMDCEGAEYDILYALPQEYFKRIGRIAMEYHGGNDRAARRKEADDLVAYLQDMGFGIVKYSEFDPALFNGGHIFLQRT